jgi:glycosyltransferase involved in cell wall biosynthesis
MRVFWRKITQMIAVSQAVATTFADNDIHAQQTEIIPNGVDLREFEEPPTPSPIRKQLKIPEGARIIVSAGRLAPEKGYDILIAAFRHLRLQNPHVHCLIVGDGDEEESLKQLGWGEKNLHFVGAVPNAIPYLQAADVVAVPSRMEGQGIVALEAMAAGKPVVATRVGGLVETVEEQITGTLVPPHDPFSLSNALSLLLTSPELCKAMGRAGRKRIESRYTAELMMRRTEDLYLRLTTQKAV